MLKIECKKQTANTKTSHYQKHKKTYTRKIKCREDLKSETGERNLR